MKKCPKCGNKTFEVNAHVVQGWLVDGDGDFTAVTEDCVEVTHRPDNDDIWVCSKCGYDAAGSEFEVQENPKISMKSDFRILKKKEGVIPVYRSLTKKDLDSCTPGGFTFVINGKYVPFDFDAHACNEAAGVFHYESGKGPFFDSYEISEDYDKMLAKEGLSRENLTAEFLASTTKIYEFFVEFEDINTPVTDGGWYGSNLKGDPQFKVELLKVSFIDINSGKEYFLKDSVLEAFNRGE